MTGDTDLPPATGTTLTEDRLHTMTTTDTLQGMTAEDLPQRGMTLLQGIVTMVMRDVLHPQSMTDMSALGLPPLTPTTGSGQPLALVLPQTTTAEGNYPDPRGEGPPPPPRSYDDDYSANGYYDSYKEPPPPAPPQESLGSGSYYDRFYKKPPPSQQPSRPPPPPGTNQAEPLYF